MVNIPGKSWVRTRQPADTVEPYIAAHDTGIEGKEREGYFDDTVGCEHPNDYRRGVLEYESTQDYDEREGHRAACRTVDKGEEKGGNGH